MDDSAVMRRLQRLGDLGADSQRISNRQPSVREHLRQLRSFNQFEHQRVCPVELLETVYRPDVRVIDRREDSRFTFEALKPIRIVSPGGGKHFQRDIAAEARVVCAIDLAHSAGAECGHNHVRADVPADHWPVWRARVLARAVGIHPARALWPRACKADKGCNRLVNTSH